MPLRIFGAGNPGVRPCPACERKIKADATFCPSCYMVFRPEGTAALREYLHGARVPADVYLLRKMQTEDPNAGPVTRTDPRPATVPMSAPTEIQPEAPPKPATSEALALPTESTRPDRELAPSPSASTASLPKEKAGARDGDNGRPALKTRHGVEGFLAFVEPLPPTARSAEEVPSLYLWMLEKDPVIPNNLARLQAIHAEVFRNKPVAHLGYEQHLLLQVAEDVGLYTTEDALGYHLSQLAGAYRRAADAYRQAEAGGAAAMNHALWQMASLASRMRLEAWVFQARHGEPPQLPGTHQRELPLKFPRK